MYDIATGESSRLKTGLFAVTTGRGKDDVYVIGFNYLMDDYVPGLELWQGRNTLARTDRNELQIPGQYTKVKSTWITVTPNNRFALALSSHITESTRYYRLWAATLSWNTAEALDEGHEPFSTKELPREWLPFMRVLPDGYTLVASPTLDSTNIPNIYIYNLDNEDDRDTMLVNAAYLLGVDAYLEGR